MLLCVALGALLCAVEGSIPAFSPVALNLAYKQTAATNVSASHPSLERGALVEVFRYWNSGSQAENQRIRAFAGLVTTTQTAIPFEPSGLLPTDTDFALRFSGFINTTISGAHRFRCDVGPDACTIWFNGTTLTMTKSSSWLVRMH